MKFLDNHPKCRLVFAAVYILYFAIYVTPISVGNAVIAVFGLFGAYLSVVKSGVIRDKNADSISNFNFDLNSLAASVVLIFEILT